MIPLTELYISDENLQEKVWPGANSFIMRLQPFSLENDVTALSETRYLKKNALDWAVDKMIVR
jgi:hypothetical protein